MRTALILLLTLFWFVTPATQATEALFPKPKSLVPAVEFWKRVYAEIGTDRGFIHDSVHMDKVYATLKLKSKNTRSQSREILRELDKHKKALRNLANGKRKSLSTLEQRLLRAWGPRATGSTFKRAAKNIRFQRGQADKFKAGLIRSGAYVPYIRKTLRQFSLPLELAALPHVESSFNPFAYSKVGAAGMWQFTRSTGRRYMRIDHVVDERMNPKRATVAAAELLQHNYSVLKSWPLALTAYNHGLAGMRRAARDVGTKDISVVVKRYKGRTFGFASRNFYTAFLAALEISQNPGKYFGALVRDSPQNWPIIKTKAWFLASEMSRSLGVEKSRLKSLNPSLRPAVWSGEKYIPKGFALKLPNNRKAGAWQSKLVRLAGDIGHSKQKPDQYYRVRRGDNLSTIARRHKTSTRTLMSLNNLRSKNHIRIGQKLRLPGGAPVKPVKPVTTAKADTRKSSGSRPGGDTYRVRSGDNLSVIARRTGVPMNKLLTLNGLSKKSTIHPGQQLALTEKPTQVAMAKQAEKPAPKPARAVTAKKPAQQPDEPTATPAPEAAPDPATVAQLQHGTTGEETVPTLSESVDGDLGEDPGPVAMQPDLAADPSDYTVDKKGRIEVQAVETLGHYADWLEIKTSKLRRLNRLRYGKGIAVGSHIKLDLSKINSSEFERLRQDFHIANQAWFFDNHVIVGSCTHTIKSGQSLWTIANDLYHIPFWLLRQYNPEITLDSGVRRGQKLLIPEVKTKTGGTGNNDAESRAEVRACRPAAQ